MTLRCNGIFGGGGGAKWFDPPGSKAYNWGIQELFQLKWAICVVSDCMCYCVYTKGFGGMPPRKIWGHFRVKILYNF